MDGYVNIDYPPVEHTVQSGLTADRYEDIVELKFDAGTVDEVRLHHVFEHFTRQVAMALLCRWTDWLKPGGLLRIETPDVMACARALLSPFRSDGYKQQVIRHLFGSHEAKWAGHWDGWYESRFRETLGALGYRNLRIARNRWGALRNIEVVGERSERKFTIDEYRSIVARLLTKSLVTHVAPRSRAAIANSELSMHDVWMRDWERAYSGGR